MNFEMSDCPQCDGLLTENCRVTDLKCTSCNQGFDIELQPVTVLRT